MIASVEIECLGSKIVIRFLVSEDYSFGDPEWSRVNANRSFVRRSQKVAKLRAKHLGLRDESLANALR